VYGVHTLYVCMIVDVFGNWKLLEIGLLLITGGTEYLCRILNVSFFGSAVVPASPRRQAVETTSIT